MPPFGAKRSVIFDRNSTSLSTKLNSNPDGVAGGCKFNSAAQQGSPSRGEIRGHGDTIAAQWAALEEHFQTHVKLVERFRDAGPEVVARMWKSQTNEGGQSLSQFERDALIERHCELFGTWPDVCHARNEVRSDLRPSELGCGLDCSVPYAQGEPGDRKRRDRAGIAGAKAPVSHYRFAKKVY
jgi:hypothetical protein